MNFLYYFNKIIFIELLNRNNWLCLKPGIQEPGTECGERGEWGSVIFREMLPNIPGNIIKYSGQFRQTFRAMLNNIPSNVPKKFRGMSSNILENMLKHSWECCQKFRGIVPNIPGNVLKQILIHKFQHLIRMGIYENRGVYFFTKTQPVYLKPVLLASAKIPERNGSIMSCSFYGQLPDYQSHVLALPTL